MEEETRYYNALQYGIIGDGKTDNTEALQALIDLISETSQQEEL